MDLLSTRQGFVVTVIRLCSYWTPLEVKSNPPRRYDQRSVTDRDSTVDSVRFRESVFLQGERPISNYEFYRFPVHRYHCSGRVGRVIPLKKYYQEEKSGRRVNRSQIRPSHCVFQNCRNRRKNRASTRSVVTNRRQHT